MYFDIEMTEDKKMMKEKKKIKNHEAPGCVNLVMYGNLYVAQTRRFMAHLLHKTNGGVKYDIKGTTD